MNTETFSIPNWITELQRWQRNWRWVAACSGALIPLGVLVAFIASIYSPYWMFEALPFVIGGAYLFYLAVDFIHYLDDRIAWWRERGAEEAAEATETPLPHLSWQYGDILEMKNESYHVRVFFECYGHSDLHDMTCWVTESLRGNFRVGQGVEFANTPGAWRLFKKSEDTTPWWEKPPKREPTYEYGNGPRHTE